MWGPIGRLPRLLGEYRPSRSTPPVRVEATQLFFSPKPLSFGHAQRGPLPSLSCSPSGPLSRSTGSRVGTDAPVDGPCVHGPSEQPQSLRRLPTGRLKRAEGGRRPTVRCGLHRNDRPGGARHPDRPVRPHHPTGQGGPRCFSAGVARPLSLVGQTGPVVRPRRHARPCRLAHDLDRPPALRGGGS